MAGNELQVILNPPLWLKMLAQLFCLGAIELCCERQLAVSAVTNPADMQRWKAFNEATPPATITKKDGELPARVGPSRRTRLEGVYQMCISLAMLIPSSLGLIGYFKKDDALKRLIVDGGWGLVQLHLWTGFFSAALIGIFPRKRLLRKMRGRGDQSQRWDFEIYSQGPTSGFRWANPIVNNCAGFACALLLLGSNYFGRLDLVPLAAAAQVIWGLSSSLVPKFRMRVMVMIQAALFMIFFVLGCWLHSLPADKPAAKSSDKYEFGTPSPWLLNIMCLFSYSVAHMIPGAFMVVNMRYEYGRVAPPAITHAPGEPVLLNHKAAPPFLPLHHLSIYSFIACYAVIDVLHYLGIATAYGTDLFIMLAMGIPAIVGGTALVTFLRGDFGNWWDYSENYRPEINFDEITELDEEDLEKRVDGKRPITP